jgi:CheY-like chemotaxis protein
MRTNLDEHQKELLAAVLSSARSLDRVLCDILDLSRAESGRIEIRAEPFCLRDFATEVSAFFASQAQDMGLGFSLTVDASADRRVVGDPDRLRQILANLLGNALKFTSAGEIGLCVAAIGHGPDQRLRFEVRDTGIGFDQTQAGRLFDRFEQADSSITRAHGGSGLGLAISRELVELMDGTIFATSRQGVGSVFTVELPLRAVDDVAEPEQSPQPSAPDAPTQPYVPHLLLAEDNPTNRKVVELALAAVGTFRIDHVENGRDAVTQAIAGAYDLVLMDVHMPVMDGLSATRKIRDQEAALGLRRTPICVLSADVMPDHVKAATAAGADAHLGKPFDISELVSTVHTLSRRPETAEPILAMG